MQINRFWRIFLLVAAAMLVVGGGLLLEWNVFEKPGLTGQLLADGAGLPDRLDGYALADEVISLPFPETFGPHEDYQTEWWYYTGNLDTQDGRHFGYQLTFFRQALEPRKPAGEGTSNWRSEQLFFAHFTLTDVLREQFIFSERFSRMGAGLAGAQAAPYQVWLEDWQVQEVAAGKVLLTAQHETVSLSLVLEDTKGPVLQGLAGWAQKGEGLGHASYYYSQPRLWSEGIIVLGEEAFEVSGWSWKDHEFSTSALSEEQVGWDWFSIQLDDGTDLMVYLLRRADGSVDPYSSGVIIDSEGNTTPLSRKDFRITGLKTWVSPDSGAEYPSEWRLQIPEAEIDLTITPYISNQELLVTVVYWEGAVKVSGTHGSRDVGGSGYVELTGYAASMRGWL